MMRLELSWRPLWWLQRHAFVREELIIRYLPNPKGQEDENCLFHLNDLFHMKFWIIIWWLSIDIEEEVKIKKVNCYEGQAGYREQDWKTNSIHHGDEDYIHKLRVSKVYLETWTSVQINVLIFWSALGRSTAASSWHNFEWAFPLILKDFDFLGEPL